MNTVIPAIKRTKPGPCKIDLVRRGKGQLVIAEIKKSSRFLASATRQLQYYLWQLEKMGLEARGKLYIPEERKHVEVVLDEDAKKSCCGLSRISIT